MEENFRLVEKETAAFVVDQAYANLIRLRAGETVGNWRDSENGLGGGVYPFDVNVAFAPASTLRNRVSKRASMERRASSGLSLRNQATFATVKTRRFSTSMRKSIGIRAEAEASADTIAAKLAEQGPSAVPEST